MPKLLITLLFALPLGLAAFAQEDETAIATTAEPLPGTDADEADAEADSEEVADSDLDEQTYEEDEDDFVPSEEIPLDEPIPFPTSI